MDIQKFKDIKKELSALVKDTEFEGHVFCVGGCVRDFYMGNPIKDIDMCIDIPDGGVKLAEYFKNENIVKNVVIYPTYGTAMFKLDKFPEDELECVETRGEQYKDKNSRNPEVVFAPIEKDAIRRDLTINALYMPIDSDEIVDPTGHGIDDIKNGVIRVTNNDPDIVYNDDPLRILRTIRFATRYGFAIEDSTMASMVKLADRLSIISKERITDEFNKMLMCDRPVEALELIRKIGAMPYVIPEMVKTFDMVQNEFHGYDTVWEHTLEVVEGCNTHFKSLELMLAAVFHDIGKIKTRTVGEDGRVHFYDHEIVGADMVKKIMADMKYPNTIANDVSKLVRYHMNLKGCKNGVIKYKSLNKLMYACGTHDMFFKLSLLMQADNMAVVDKFKPDYNISAVMLKMCYDQLAAGHPSMFGYKLPVDGNDVMAVRNIGPSKEVSIVLNNCLKIAFSNPSVTRESLLSQIKHFKIVKK